MFVLEDQKTLYLFLEIRTKLVGYSELLNRSRAFKKDYFLLCFMLIYEMRLISKLKKMRHDLQVEQNPDTIDKVLQVAKQVRQLIKVAETSGK